MEANQYRGWLAATVAVAMLAGCESDELSRHLEPSANEAAIPWIEPHCPPTGQAELRITGHLEEESVDLQRSGADADGLLILLGGGVFASLSDEQTVALHLSWEGPLNPDQPSALSESTLTLPVGGDRRHYCVERGRAVRPALDALGTLKFEFTRLRAGDECDGESVSAELVGCWASVPIFRARASVGSLRATRGPNLGSPATAR